MKFGFTTASSMTGFPVAFIVTFFCKATAFSGWAPSSIRIKMRDFGFGKFTRCVPFGSDGGRLLETEGEFARTDAWENSAR